VLGQILTWGATFLVIRMLEPSDYGLFAMTQVVLVFLNLMNGWGFANSLVRDEELTRQKIRQAFGMLILLNGSLGIAQLILAPMAAAYFHQPMLADLLRVQALLYISTPFTAVPAALLSREMNFKSQAQVDLVAAGAQRRNDADFRLSRLRRVDARVRRASCSSGAVRSAFCSGPGGWCRRASASGARARCSATAARW
jgi:hypothetical protein